MRNNIVNMNISKDTKTGTLYLVATPIGNLKDITLRALEVLKTVDLIACENTISAQKLFEHYAISNKYTTYNESSDHRTRYKILKALEQGGDVAIISEAGTPLISDPGYKLVAQAISQGIQVQAIPGPTSLISALVTSGLPTDKFLFVGFLPSSEQSKAKEIEKLTNLPFTLIILESPKRLLSTLKLLKEILGNRRACVSKELTKLHENSMHGTLEELCEFNSSLPKILGEYVITVEGFNEADSLTDEQIIELLKRLMKETSLSNAVKEIASNLSISKKKVYNLALRIADK